MEMKKWTKPKILVLARHKAAEAILETCKGAGLTALSPANKYPYCYRSAAGAGNCGQMCADVRIS